MSTDRSSNGKTAAFLAWLDAKGVKVSPKIDIFHEFESTGRGVMAKEDLAVGELLLEVPSDAYMKPENDDELKKFLSGRSPAVSPTLMVVLRLMHEKSKRAESNFAEYLETMHDGMPDCPMFWTESELTELKGTAVEPLADPSIVKKAYEDVALPVIKVASVLGVGPLVSCK